MLNIIQIHHRGTPNNVRLLAVLLFFGVLIFATPRSAATGGTGGFTIIVTPPPIGGFCFGYASLSLGPPEAIAAGGGWRIPEFNIPSANTNAFTSDASIRIPLQAGTLTVFFKSLPGFAMPSNQTVQAVCGQHLVLYPQYVPLPPRLELQPGEDLRLLGSSGVTYRIEKAVSLTVLSNWNPVSTVMLNSASLTLTNIRPTTNGAGYFRARVLP